MYFPKRKKKKSNKYNYWNYSKKKKKKKKKIEKKRGGKGFFIVAQLHMQPNIRIIRILVYNYIINIFNIINKAMEETLYFLT